MSETMTDDEIREARKWAYWTDADRDRVFATVDALRARVECAEREREDTLRMWREYKLAKDAEVANADAARERAEAERDEAVVKYAEVARENATGLAAFIERGEALKRAEADNAALLDILRRWTRADGDCDAPDLNVPQNAAAFAMYMVAADTVEKPHPGAAMLEYLRALERDAYAMAEALGIYNAFIAEAPEAVQQHFAGILRVTQKGWSARDRVMDAIAADALKGES